MGKWLGIGGYFCFFWHDNLDDIFLWQPLMKFLKATNGAINPTPEDH